MATIILRDAGSISSPGSSAKGSPLTNLEVDNNFSNINVTLGVLSNLTTSATSNLVSAINSIKGNSLNQFASTTSSQLAGVISDETGSGALVFATSPTLVTPALGTPSSGTLTNTSGLPLSSGVTGTLPIANGGTGTTSTTFANLTTNVTGTLPIANGGTGQSQSYAAINALLPSQTSNTNFFLRTNGSNVLWSSADITITDDTTTNATYFLSLTTTSSGSINSANVSTSKLFFNPSTGLLTSTDYNSASDRNLKTNINNLSETIGILQQLQGVSFNWKDSGVKSFGLIAQDVEQIIPEIVTEHEGTKGINYINIIAFLIEAVKDLQSQIDQLKQQ